MEYLVCESRRFVRVLHIAPFHSFLYHLLFKIRKIHMYSTKKKNIVFFFSFLFAIACCFINMSLWQITCSQEFGWNVTASQKCLFVCLLFVYYCLVWFCFVFSFICLFFGHTWKEVDQPLLPLHLYSHVRGRIFSISLNLLLLLFCFVLFLFFFILHEIYEPLRFTVYKIVLILTEVSYTGKSCAFSRYDKKVKCVWVRWP